MAAISLETGRVSSATVDHHLGESSTLSVCGTKYSRRGRTHTVLRSRMVGQSRSIREFLCSEAMHHLESDDTSRPWSTQEIRSFETCSMTATSVQSRVPSCVAWPGASCGLVAQIHTSRGDMDMLNKLVAYTLEHHFSHLGPVNKDSTLAFLSEVGQSTARLMAEWMRVGFVHGVMNTDNMSVLGLTIDYGPYGWIDDYDPDWTPNN